MSDSKTSIKSLIFIPSVVTLAITILRLIGELNHWSETWFNPSAGGGGAVIGIVWLAPIFGIYFAVKLSSAGQGPVSAWRPVLFALLGIVVVVISFAAGAVISKDPGSLASLGLILVGSIIAIALQRSPWPSLFRVLLAYGYAARIPVAILMFFAIRGNWGTHYDAPPPRFPEMSWFPKWIVIGVLPQLVFWVTFTVVTGVLAGAVVAALSHRGRPTAQAAQA
jgi:hypothetical protein